MSLSFYRAKKHFEDISLPRFVRDEKAETEYFIRRGKRKNIYRRVVPSDTNRGELYPIFGFSADLLSHFGIGIGMYFVQLVLVSIIIFIAGIIMIVATVKYTSNSYGYENSRTFVSITASCLNPVAVLAQGCTDIATCQAYYRGNCEIPEVVILVDIIMCCFLIVSFLLSKFIESYYEEKLDVEVQSTQDYSLEVKDPDPDATDPDEWYNFFSRWGKVVYITVTKKNGNLGKLLMEKYYLKRHINEISNMEESNISTLQFFSNVVFGKKDIKYWQNKLNQIEQQLSILYLHSFPACRIFVTYEYEEHQRLALNGLEVPDIDAFLDNTSKIGFKYLFRGKNVLDVQESAEPDTIKWDNLEQSSFLRFINRLASRLLTVCMLTACYFAVKVGQQTSTTALSVLIAVIDLVLAYVFDYITELEGPQDEGRFQESLQLKLFGVRILLSTIFPYLNISNKHILDNDILIQIFSVQLSIYFSDTIFNLLDIKGMITRYVIAPLLSKNQHELSSFWISCGNWNIADRYTILSKIIYITLFYSILNPITLFIASIGIIIVFIVDHYLLVRRWEQPSMMNATVSHNLRKQCLLAVALHMIVTIRWIYSWPMDNVYQSYNSDTGTFSYVKVNKYPSYDITSLKSKYWQTKAQQKYLPIYLTLTIIIIAINLYIWFLNGLLIRIYKLFYKSVRVVGYTKRIKYSEVSDISAYIPITSKNGDKLIFANTSLMLNKHKAPIHTIDGIIPDLSIDIPQRYRKHILANVKWYGDEPVDLDSNKNNLLLQQLENFNKNIQLNESNLGNSKKLFNTLDQSIELVIKDYSDNQLHKTIDSKSSNKNLFTYDEKNVLRKLRQVFLSSTWNNAATDTVDFAAFNSRIMSIYPKQSTDTKLRITLRHIFSKLQQQFNQKDNLINWKEFVEFVQKGHY